MEIESVNAKANAGLATGIIGTAFGLLNHGFGGFGFGGNGFGAGNAAVSGLCAGIPEMVTNTIGRREYEDNNRYLRELSQKDSEIQALKLNTQMDSKVLDLYRYVESQLHNINDKFAAQGVWNATTQGNVGFISSQVSDLKRGLDEITRVVVPNSAICPGWGEVTITPTAPTVTTPTA